MALTVKELIEDFRDLVGDETQTYPVRIILSWMNESLRELTNELIHFTPFVVDDTIELADYTETGKAAQEWRLDDDKIGDIAHIRSLRLINTNECPECDTVPVYANNAKFNASLVNKCNNCPCGKRKCCLNEIVATYTKRLTGTYLRVSAPLPSGTVAQVEYEFVPRRYTKADLNEVVPINLTMLNLLYMLMQTKFHRYNVDDTRAQATYESFDKAVYEIKQQLARDNSDFVLKRSF